MQLLDKIDNRLTSTAFSRPYVHVSIIVRKLKLLDNARAAVLIDIGGGSEPQYKPLLSPLAKKYVNLEIKKGSGVDIVGSVYAIPLKKNTVDIATMFMVLEHLEKPLDALKEAHRVLKKDGYIAATTVQYWHNHNHPSDFFRYTKTGLEYLCKEVGFRVVDIWSIGGPFLVAFHAIELNLPGMWRTIFSILFYRLFDWLDWIVFKHNDIRVNNDSVGWAFIAQKV